MEINFDGLIGPSHNYGGLSPGNMPSTLNVGEVSKPRQAALQGLDKMSFFVKQGFTQGVLPPPLRPRIDILKQLGFRGQEEEIIKDCAQKAPWLLNQIYSASNMWTANAATISPSADSYDGKLHISPANLQQNFHRFIEGEKSAQLLKRVFKNPEFFTVHPLLPKHNFFGDEGAANHNRLCSDYSKKGLEIFVYGQSVLDKKKNAPSKMPARQSLEASQAIARRHGLKSENTIFVQQNPEVIDQGVFHNDVISVSNLNVFMYHQEAFCEQQSFLRELRKKSEKLNIDLCLIEIKKAELSIKDAVSSYLFNTQIIRTTSGQMAIIAPSECQENKAAHACLEKIKNDVSNPISELQFFDIRQSMKNGGGPACLRLRVAVNEEEKQAINPAYLLTEEKIEQLRVIVNKHYREEISNKDLADPQLLRECRLVHEEYNKFFLVS